MTAIVIAFPYAAHQPVVYRPLYAIDWTTENGVHKVKSTHDADVIRRQLASCLGRRIVARVRRDGKLCGGVIAFTRADGSQHFASHFEDDKGA